MKNKLTKQVISIFSVLLILCFSMIQNGAFLRSRADPVTDVFTLIYYQYLLSTGVTATSSVPPLMSAGIATEGAAHGMKFGSKVQIDNFVNGFMSYLAWPANTLGQHIGYSIVQGKECYTFDETLISRIKDYIQDLKAKKNQIITCNLTNIVHLDSSNRSAYITIKDLNPGTYNFSLTGSVPQDKYIETSLKFVTGSNILLDMYSSNHGTISTYSSKPYIVVNSDKSWILYNSNGTATNISGNSIDFQFKVAYDNYGDMSISADWTITMIDKGQQDLINGDTTSVTTNCDNQVSALDDASTFSISADISRTDAIPTTIAQSDTKDLIATAANEGVNVKSVSDVVKPIDWTLPGTKSIDWSPLENIQLFDKFPFCLPFDAKNLVSGLVATPVAPDFKIDIPMSALHLPDFVFEVDFSKYEDYVKVIRWGILICVTGALIFGMYKIIKH